MSPQQKEGPADPKWIKETLVFNADKEFVQRLFKKDAPQLFIGKDLNGKDIWASHQMSAEYTGPPNDANTKVIVYPNIIFDKKKKGLMWLPPERAKEYAIKSGEHIEVGSIEEGVELSKHYKTAIPGFDERKPLSAHGSGSQSHAPTYTLFEPQEEKDEKKRKERLLGLIPPEPPKVKKNGK